MTCKNLPDCEFIDKISGTMPHTTEKIKQTCCRDKKKCLKNRLAKTMIEHIEEEKPADR